MQLKKNKKQGRRSKLEQQQLSYNSKKKTIKNL